MSTTLPDEFNPFLKQVDLREPEPYNIGITGWEGDSCPVLVTQRGAFYARLGEVFCRFGIADETGALTWENAEGYLPCLVSSFEAGEVKVSISHFCNRVSISGNDFSLLYSRISKTNTGGSAVELPAAPSAELVRLNGAPGKIGPGETQVEDFVTAVDRFGQDVPWPDAGARKQAGSLDENYVRMRDYWNGRLAEVAQFEKLPDQRLAEAFKAGHIYQLIVMEGLQMNVGVNAYREEFSHDTIGMVATLIQTGDLDVGRRILDVNRARLVAPLDYPDGDYKYPWPWAVYLLKSGDVEFVRSNFTVIRAIMRASASQATGPGGIMRLSCALDHPSHWLVDNWSMLTGLASYRVIAERLGEEEEVRWAVETYDKLLDACNACIAEVSEREGINYLSAFMLGPYKDRPARDNTSAGWATALHMGRWPWEGWMLGARQDGIMLDNIDSTYDYGFQQSSAVLPPHSFGGFDGWCTSYNAGFGFAGLRGDRYRAEGIRAYQWMIDNGMNGPYSWWESSREPAEDSDWQPGRHPARGTGSCPHMWGDSFSRKILLNSLVDEFADGRVIIGRGVPEEWLEPGQEIRISNVLLQDRRRFGFHMTCDDESVRIIFTGDHPAGEIVLDLPGPPGWNMSLPADAREVTLLREV